MIDSYKNDIINLQWINYVTINDKLWKEKSLYSENKRCHRGMKKAMTRKWYAAMAEGGIGNSMKAMGRHEW